MDGFQYKFGDQPLEGYTIQRAIGRGGFGEVYYAISDSGREVALKVVQGYEDIELRGVSQCMNLKSPHLVTIFDVKRNAEGRPFVIMECVAGPSLRELLEDAPSGLGTQKAAFFLREIAKGLTYLHDRGIVHRDLKPGNIFYEDGYVKIGDYGLSKIIASSQHTVQTITVGTVHYMAPEIGQGKYDRSIDIYALGIVLYEMLTGQVPFFGSSHGEVLMKHLTGQPDLSHIEEPFATVIRKAMAKDPAQRYQSVQEMVEAVFGAEHIQQSVSHFSPESLSMVAHRVAQKVTVGGSGSSAEHAQGLGPNQPTTEGGSSDVWQDLSQQMDQFGRRMGQWGQRFGEQMANVGTRVGKEFGVEPKPDAAPTPTGTIDPSLDPLDRRARNRLWLIAAVVMGAGTGIIQATSRSSVPPIELSLFAIAVILLSSVAISRTGRLLAERMQKEHGLGRYIAFGGAAAIGVLAAAFLGAVGPMNRQLHSTLDNNVLPLLASCFFIDWLGRINPLRQQRISFESALTAGFIGFLASIFTDASMILMVGILAGLSMAAQAGSLFVPPAIRKSLGRQLVRNGHQGQAPRPAGAPTAPGQGGPEARAAHPAERSPLQPLAPATPPGLVIPVFVRALCLLAFVMLLGGSIVFFIGAGMTNSYHDPETFAGCLAAGIGAAMFGLFALAKARQRYLVSWWSGVIKPLLLIACLVSMIAAICVMGNVRLSSDETMIASAFIVFPVILFIVVACISNTTIGAILGEPMARAVPSTIPPTHATGISPRGRLWAILLSLVLFVFGLGGLHRMYVGKIGTGILWLVTFGGFFIGQIVDIIMIASGQFTDKQGRPLLMWTNPNEFRGVSRASAENANPTAPVAADPVAIVAGTSTLEIGSFVLAGLGMLVLLAGMFTGLLVAVHMPTVIAEGIPDPRLAEEITNEFGYSDWPQLFERIGTFLTVFLFLASCAILLVARRKSGGAHCLRAVLGPVAIGIGLAALSDATRRISWSTVASLVDANRIGPAIDAALGAIDEETAMISAVLLLVSIVLLFWPARRRETTPVTTAGGVA